MNSQSQLLRDNKRLLFLYKIKAKTMKLRLLEGTVVHVDKDTFEAKLVLLRPSSFPGLSGWHAVIDKASVPPKYAELLKPGAVFYMTRRGLSFRRLPWTRRQLALIREDVSLFRPKWKTKVPPNWETQLAQRKLFHAAVDTALSDHC